jgi:hypothetical protein
MKTITVEDYDLTIVEDYYIVVVEVCLYYIILL